MTRKEILAAFKALLELAESHEEQIESEWGSCRSLEQMETDGTLSPAIAPARVAIAALEAAWEGMI